MSFKREAILHRQITALGIECVVPCFDFFEVLKGKHSTLHTVPLCEAFDAQIKKSPYVQTSAESARCPDPNCAKVHNINTRWSLQGDAATVVSCKNFKKGTCQFDKRKRRCGFAHDVNPGSVHDICANKDQNMGVIVMQHIPGKSLRKHDWRKGAFGKNITDLIRIGAHISRALWGLNQAGYVHQGKQ